MPLAPQHPLTAALAAVLLLGAALTGAGSAPAHAAMKKVSYDQSTAVSKTSSASIVLDGYPLKFPVAPLIRNGSTLVPFRSIAEALNVAVAWNAKAKAITAVKSFPDESKRSIELRLGSAQALLDGRPVKLGQAPIQSSGTVLVPLSFFSTAFGAQVSWNGASKTVSIQSPAERIYTKAYYAIESFSQLKHLNRFDAVAFGWGRIGEDGRLTLKGRDFYWPQPSGSTTPESIVADASATGVNTQFMVFGVDGKGELTKLLGDKKLREEAIEGIVSTASIGGFNGISLDFEGLGLTGDKLAVQKSFTGFVTELRAASQKAGLGLTLALHPLNGAYGGYDYKALAKQADEIVIMAYAYEGEKGPEPLNRVDEAIRLALKEVGRSKLLLGISMGSETAESLRGPAGLAKRYGLKGIALWRLGAGLVDGDSIAALENTVKLK
ncbi:stalk domain-containing protein [Paenibacillus pasadenensis]|uniref:stalk domain-containing protein n=1 Tax=Paenibacillus pasadenensis TaxID=217090 RepID=UPI00203AB7B8|nr:stalk domain-containing protein [Paenibacillus pasadenensis]MCM3747687.1 stalk domain-containing protein [Paenibacillus pasadenensis]